MLLIAVDPQGNGTVRPMTTKDQTRKSKPGRPERLSEQLRANLMRRKQQARARREGAADERPDGIALARPAPAKPASGVE
jgi:hypothetical protein